MKTELAQLLTIHTTPQQLIRLASRLQAAWDVAKLGENVPKERVEHYTDKLVVEYTIDQDEMHRESPKGSK